MRESPERAGCGVGGRIRPSAFEHPGLALVRDYLEQDVSRELTLGVAAQISRLNSKYFSALFHERVGVRFIDWLHFVRTEQAKRLLDETAEPIARVAERVGYNDLRTFERAFKKSNGRTAQQYRRRRAAPAPPPERASPPAPGP